jgi:hypothetical protein
MLVAFPRPQVARERGLNSNHHLRVWCSCMAGQINPGGYSGRSQSAWLSDARRAGAWDELGVVDVRQPNSALELWKEHLR